MKQRSRKLKHAADVDCVKNVTRKLNRFDQNAQYWGKNICLFKRNTRVCTQLYFNICTEIWIISDNEN